MAAEDYKYQSKVPVLTGDPFLLAQKRIEQSSKRKTGVHFGAERGAVLHPGVDYMVPNNTPLQIPVEKAVVIGICRTGRDAPAATQGNTLVLFAPGDMPRFIFLLHLADKTFGKSGRLRVGGQEIAIGAEIARGRIGTAPIAYVGDTASKGIPHLHLSVANRLPYSSRIEGRIQQLDATLFQQMYNDGRLADFLANKNLNALKLPGKGGLEKRGYVNPMGLIAAGEIRIARAIIPETITHTKTEEPIRLARNKKGMNVMY